MIIPSFDLKNTFYQKPSRFFRLLRFSIKFKFNIDPYIKEYLSKLDKKDYEKMYEEEYECSNELQMKKCYSLTDSFINWMKLCKELQINRIFQSFTQKGRLLELFN